MSQIDLAKINAAAMVQMTDDEREVYLMDHPEFDRGDPCH